MSHEATQNVCTLEVGRIIPCQDKKVAKMDKQKDGMG